MALLRSQVKIVEAEPQIRSAAPIPTSLPAFLGITERGPVGDPQFITSFADYVKIFGGFTVNSDLSLAMQGFFDNGGTSAWVSRTLHYTDITSAATQTGVASTVTLVDRAGSPLSTLTVAGKTPGTYADDIKAIIEDATSGDTDEFNLTVEEDGVVKEIFPNLSMTDIDVNYIESIINDPDTGSNLIVVTDLDSATSTPNDLPALGTFTLTGGDDGLTSLDDADFTGNEAAETGVHAFDDVQDITILVIPGRATSAVQNKMISYCEVTRAKSMFAIMDPPAGLTGTGIVTYKVTTAALVSEFAALYWPRIKILNPSAVIFGTGTQITVPPSGHICGVYARTDGSFTGGVYRAPAGVEVGRIFNALGFETDEVLKDAIRDLIFPQLINPLTSFPGSARFIDGSRTLLQGGNFPSVPERRGVIFIEQTIKRTLETFRQSQNDEITRANVENTITAFLLTQTRNRAFKSTDPAKAFIVDADVPGETINPPSEQAQGNLNVTVGLATNKPLEFLILEFSQDVRALEEEIQLANGR